MERSSLGEVIPSARTFIVLTSTLVGTIEGLNLASHTKGELTMFIIDLIIAFGYIALVVLVLGTLVYFAPVIADFIKSFIKWHFHD